MSDFNFTSIIDGSNGSAQGRVGTTIETLIISVASGFVLFSVQFVIFLIIRIYPWAKRIYQPRSFLVPLKNRIQPPPNNPFKWIATVFKVHGPVLLEKSGMDGYFFIRYLSMCLKIFFPMAVIIVPILLPINHVNGKGTQTIEGVRYNITGLDTLAWSNVPPTHTGKYWAHLVLALGVILWVCYTYHRELIHYVHKRQDFLSHPSHRLKASATTVLITDIPSELCTVEKLTEHYDDFPGGIRRIWINRDFRPLVKLVEQRNKLESQLENAETNLIRKCVKLQRKDKTASQKTYPVPSGSESSLPPDGQGRAEGLGSPALRHSSREHVLNAEEHTSAQLTELCRRDLQNDLEHDAAWTRYLTPKKRPTMRIAKEEHPILFHIPLLGRFFSTKLDTIYYCRWALAKLNVEVEKEVLTSDAYSHVHSAFIQFNTQKAAHLACQSLGHPDSRAMTRRNLELAPADINWPNVGVPWWQRYLRIVGFLFLFVVLIFVFGIISFFTGILSKAGTLADSTSWLAWISDLPSWLLSFIQGTLPPVILIILLSGPLPIFLRLFTNNVRGATTGTDGERSLQLWYFVFLLFELFIVPTISSGLTAVVEELVHNPTSIPNILATNLPTAANYYFSFLIVNSLSLSASSILQTIRLLNYYVLGSTNTPDSVFDSLTFTNRTRIGSNIPWYTTFAVIGLVYSVIAPLMLIFILITFALFWVVIKNNLLYVVRTGDVDGGALWFPSALNQTFTGLYFLEVCLIGLFFLVRDDNGNVACDVQGAIMVVALIFTIFYQWWLYSSLHPLFTYLPVTMEGEAQQRDKEYEAERLVDQEKLGSTGSETHIRSSENAEDHQNGLQYTQSSTKRPITPPSSGTTANTSDRHSLSSPRAQHIRLQQERDDKSAKRILARLNRPLDESRLAALEEHLHTVERSVGNRLVPRREDVEKQMMNDPISKIIMQHNDELEDLNAEERDLLISVAFTHPVLRETRPSVWIPQDSLGVSDDEVRRTREQYQDVVIDNRGAFFDKKLKVDVNRPPPDMSEFTLILGDL